jgi:hypothetical protein
MALQCPHCHGAFVIEGTPPREVVCPSCGSSIQLSPGDTTGWLPEEVPKRLGRFVFLEQLGVGSFGTVYKARDTELDRLVAIKIPRTGSLAGRPCRGPTRRRCRGRIGRRGTWCW